MPQTQYRKPYTRAQGARKPASPQQLLERAVQIATEKGIKVAFAGDGFWAVPSDSEALKGLYHIVQRSADGKHLTCECLYSQNKPSAICSHRAAVYTYLKGQPKAEPEAEGLRSQTNKNSPAAHPACTCGNRLAWVCKRDQARCLKCGWQGRFPQAQEASSSGDSPQTVAVSSPDAPPAPSASLKVAAPTAAPSGVLVAATAPKIGTSCQWGEGEWDAYQERRYWNS